MRAQALWFCGMLLTACSDGAPEAPRTNTQAPTIPVRDPRNAAANPASAESEEQACTRKGFSYSADANSPCSCPTGKVNLGNRGRDLCVPQDMASRLVLDVKSVSECPTVGGLWDTAALVCVCPQGQGPNEVKMCVPNGDSMQAACTSQGQTWNAATHQCTTNPTATAPTGGLWQTLLPALLPAVVGAITNKSTTTTTSSGVDSTPPPPPQ